MEIICHQRFLFFFCLYVIEIFLHMRLQSSFGHDQYWRIVLTYSSHFFWRQSRSFPLFYLNRKKKLARDRYLPTFNYTTASRERNVNKASLIFSFFDGAYLINMLNRFNSERTRSQFRKRMFNSTYWIIKIREKKRNLIGVYFLDQVNRFFFF
jgi:hypothetical protein